MVECNNREPLVLVFDIGTQSTRGFLFNNKGDIVCQSKVDTVPYFSNRIGYAEKNTVEYWDALVAASQALKASAGELWDNVKLMAMTSIRATYAFLDKDMNPVRPTITWLDQRLAKAKQKFSLNKKFLYALSGSRLVTLKQRRMAPATWMKENEPANWDKTAKYCLISAYINYKLTGNLVDSMAAQASRLPYNYRHHRWMKRSELTFEVFNCSKDKLCGLVEPMSDTGYVTEETAALTGIPVGLRVITTGSDKACETLGVGCMNDKVASISFGTTATIQYVTDTYKSPQSFMPSYNAVIPGKFNPEMQIFRGYWMITWFKEQFAYAEVQEARQQGLKVEEYLDTMLSRIPAGSDGLILQPYWAPGLKNPEAKGSIIGFNDYHTKAHFYKAIIEGIGYALYAGHLTLSRRTGNLIESLSVSGGGSQSDAVCQITADMFGLPVMRVQTYETSGLGAAIIAFCALGEFKNIEGAVKSMVTVKDKFYPKMENHKTYTQLYEKVYRKIYKKLQPLYMDLYEIVNE